MQEKVLYSIKYYDKTQLGIKIIVEAKELPNLDGDLIDEAAYNAANLVKEEMIALMNEKDPTCDLQRIAERSGLLSIFPDNIFVEEVPNGYCNRACCRHLPWFVIATKIGRFKLGWRKSVIQIEWDQTVGTKTAEELFSEEDVTKDKKMIHAWSLKKAEEYVKKIMDNLI